MSTTVPATHLRRWGRFVLHYVEMVVAMAVGMALLHPAAMWALDIAGRPELMATPEIGTLIMATTMALPMAAWMRVRGHRWRPVLEMSAAMYVPFVVLFVPMWLGLITVPEMYEWGHLLMLGTMAGAMLLRRDEYAHG